MSQASITAATLADTTEARRAARSLLWAAIWSTAASAMARTIGWYAEQRRIKRATGELSRLSERMLKDIGVARHDIPRLARHGRDATDIRA
jgi:uncharacterized protein YjiS (DUF1127 family)